MDTTSIEAVNNFITNFSPLAPFFPGGLMSYDREGNILYIQPLGRLNPASMVRSGRVSRLYHMLMLEAYATHQLTCAQEEIRQKRLGQIAIFDMAGSSHHLIFMPGIKIISSVYSTLQLMFPGVSRKLYVINTSPFIIQSARLVKLFITERTKEAFEFLDDNWQTRLKDELGEENILPYWGGTMNANPSTGSIRMGGEPTQKAIELSQPPARVLNMKLKQIRVSPRHCCTLDVNIEMQGQILRWFFKCGGGDVEFWIQKDAHEVVPRLRLSTHFVPEFGEVKCQETGLYKICFDNQHSMLRSKTIAYKIEVYYVDE